MLDCHTQKRDYPLSWELNGHEKVIYRIFDIFRLLKYGMKRRTVQNEKKQRPQKKYMHLVFPDKILLRLNILIII